MDVAEIRFTGRYGRVLATAEFMSIDPGRTVEEAYRFAQALANRDKTTVRAFWVRPSSGRRLAVEPEDYPTVSINAPAFNEAWRKRNQVIMRESRA